MCCRSCLPILAPLAQSLLPCLTVPLHRSDTSPILVELREVRPGLLRLLVRTCAVVGGAFALTGLWDKAVHQAVTALTRKSRQQ